MDKSTFVATPNLLILVGYGSDQHEYKAVDELVQSLAKRLRIPIQTAFLETSPSVGESIQNGVIEHQPRAVIVLPLFLGVSSAKKKNVEMIVDAANERGLDVLAHYGKPLDTHSGVVSAYSDLLTAILRSTKTAAEETALLVVGRGSRDSESNAEVYQMARRLYEKGQYSSFDVAFHALAKPDIAAGIKRCVQTGAKRIVILSYVLYDEHLTSRIEAQAQQNRALYPDVEITFAPHLNVHNGILDAISQRYEEALAEMNSESYLNRPRPTHSHGAGISHAHQALSFSTGLENLLPPRYQGEIVVSAAPMGAADLIFDAEGRVAWDQIWGDFCDLALAGGPPHRGTLLEPVSPEVIIADPNNYTRVLAELDRGIRMITKLPIIRSSSLGWIGVQCADEAMALWLLRAIVVENISIRREGDVLYFPAGPHFRLEHEIKNIITVIAKTHHYWTEHINSQIKTNNMDVS